MNEKYKEKMLLEIKVVFQELIKRRKKKLLELSKLKNHDLNPLLDRHKALFLFGNESKESLARALIYPSIIGTGLNTSFGQLMQKNYLTKFENVTASGIKGLDIEFDDFYSGEKIYCQLKSGVNTINAEDVNPIIEHFTKAIRLIRENGGASVPQENFIIGVFQGEKERLNGNYKKLEIKSNHKVIVGQEFWSRITGSNTFYQELSLTLKEFQQNNSNQKELVESAVLELAKQL